MFCDAGLRAGQETLTRTIRMLARLAANSIAGPLPLGKPASLVMHAAKLPLSKSRFVDRRSAAPANGNGTNLADVGTMQFGDTSSPPTTNRAHTILLIRKGPVNARMRIVVIGS